MTLRKLLLACGAIGLSPLAAHAQNKTWTVDADFDAGLLTQVAHPPSDQLQLGPTPVTKTSETWACHTANAMVVKIDTNTGKQLGRYDVTLQSINGVPTGADREFGSDYPRRVGVDNNGDVWITNLGLGPGGQGTMSKFSGFNEHCIDRNHNGQIDTSHDANNDGIINTFDANEFKGQNDECILTTLKVGVPNAYPRGVAADRNGKIWVCENNCVGGACHIYRYNPAEPVALEATLSVQGNPYSLSSGGQYVYYGSSGGGFSARINIDTLQIDYLQGCPSYYGALAAHPTQDIVYYGSYNGGLVKADFKARTCQNLGGPAIYTVGLDANFNVWGGNLSYAYVVKWGPNGNMIGQYVLPGSSHGISTDFNGNVWLNGYSPSFSYKINSMTGAVLGQYPYDCPGCPNPAGVNYTSYLYSDFTGFQVNRQAPYTYYGTWTGTFDGGADGIPWSEVDYNTEPQAATPCDNVNKRCTGLAVFVRAHDDMNKLATVGFTPVTSGQPLKGIVGHYVQVEADLTGPGYLTPVLSDVTVLGPCQNGINDMCCLADNTCDDANPCTVDSCPQVGGACKHVQKMACCAADKDCSDGNVCTTDKCPMPGGLCANTVIPGCCNADKDCGDGNLCTTDVCSGKGGVCSHAPIGGCCNQNPDCDDGNMCTIDLCSGPGGTCSHFAKANCCNVDGDCDDVNSCTTDRCENGQCAHPGIPGCCNADMDCDDGKDCTDDKCSGKGGVCNHTAKMNCCTGALQCGDNDACTNDDCVKGSCTHAPIIRCCNLDKECNDNDVCTTDGCTGPGGTCAHARVAGCCNLNTDCDDRDPCTVDKCSGQGGQCAHQPVGSGCCKKDTDCDDQIACTTDRCNGGAACEHQPLANCFCASDNDCPPGQLCSGNACSPPQPDGGVYQSNEYATGLSTFGGCAVSARGRGAPGTLLAVALLALALLRRRRSW